MPQLDTGDAPGTAAEETTEGEASSHDLTTDAAGVGVAVTTAAATATTAASSAKRRASNEWSPQGRIFLFIPPRHAIY